VHAIHKPTYVNRTMEGDRTVSEDEIAELDADELDAFPLGIGLSGTDYGVLLGLGLLAPVALLIWGWM